MATLTTKFALGDQVWKVHPTTEEIKLSCRLCRGRGWLDAKGAGEEFVEGVIQAALGRLEFYQSTEFRCRENALAITKLEEALHWCQHRTAARESRGVEGIHAQ
jgi:hypothetical protein